MSQVGRFVYNQSGRVRIYTVSPKNVSRLTYNNVDIRDPITIIFSRQLSYNNRLNEMKLWSLKDRRQRVDLIEVYKMTLVLSAVNFSHFFFMLDSYSRSRGHSWKLKKSPDVVQISDSSLARE